VLIDGRTVYSPLYSGVFWESQQVMVEDIERIEVVSGPGATLWGTNAVNGVINVITRAAKDTQGLLVAAGFGNRDQSQAFRYGGRLGEAGHYRIYARRYETQNTMRANGTSLSDGRQIGQAGIRADWQSSVGAFTVQADTYDGKSEHGGFIGPFELAPVWVSGTYVLARWSRALENGSDIRVQTYYDHTRRNDPLFYRPTADIFDVEFQHGLPIGAHRLVWGANYRRARDDVLPGQVFTRFVPQSRELDYVSVFGQGEMKLTKALELTAGMRFERNDYTGWEYLPSARLAWKVTDNALVWGAVSRAVRAPSRLDREVFFPANPPFLLVGGPNFVSEVANVIEVGHRAQFGKLTYSVTAFRHIWDKLRSGSGTIPGTLVNEIDGFVQGIEAWAALQPIPAWRLSGGYLVLSEHLGLKPESRDTLGVNNPQLANDPDYQFVVRSSHNLSERHELDIMWRHVSRLALQSVPAYSALDVRFGYRVTPNAELSITGNNLFDRKHAEFGAAPGRPEFRRSVFVKLLLTQ
jgi:iron complex outermembrane recepter protein